MQPARSKSASALALLVGFLVLFFGAPVSAVTEDLIPVKLVTILTVDDQGLPLRHPYYVFYDRYTGETYCISANGRITVFNQEYFPLVSIGPGRGINNARGLDVDRDGNLYVCQSEGPGGPRVTILNAAYFIKKEILMKDIAGTGIDMSQYRPARIRVAADGRFYLLEGGSTAVLVLKPDGTFDHWLRAWDELLRPETKEIANQPAGTLRKNPAALDSGGEEDDSRPYGAVALSDFTIDSEGRIYLVSNETSKVYVFDPREKFLFSFGEKGGADRKMSQPFGVAVDVERQVIYVIDYMRHTVLVYDYYTGRYVFEFGGRGATPLWFNFPDSIAVDRDGNCLLAHTFNMRLQVTHPHLRVRRPRIPGVQKKAKAPPLPAAAAPSPAAPPRAATSPLVPPRFNCRRKIPRLRVVRHQQAQPFQHAVTHLFPRQRRPFLKAQTVADVKSRQKIAAVEGGRFGQLRRHLCRHIFFSSIMALYSVNRFHQCDAVHPRITIGIERNGVAGDGHNVRQLLANAGENHPQIAHRLRLRAGIPQQVGERFTGMGASGVGEVCQQSDGFAGGELFHGGGVVFN